MAICWYIIPYKRQLPNSGPFPVRYCEIDDYTSEIYAAGGAWTETEILGDRAIVKLRAPDAFQTQATALWKRLPKDRIDDSLSDLSNAAKKKIRDEILDQGYTIQQINDRLPNDFGTYTLRQVLHFMATKRRKPRYDRDLDEIFIDGIDQPCRSIDSVDAEVTE